MQYDAGILLSEQSVPCKKRQLPASTKLLTAIFRVSGNTGLLFFDSGLWPGDAGKGRKRLKDWIAALRSRPCACAHFLQCTLRPPAQYLLGFANLCVASRNVARPTCRDLIFHGFTADGFKRFDHFKNTGALACAQIKDVGYHVGGAWLQPLTRHALVPVQEIERGQMALGEVYDVDVVSDAGTVGRRVVVAKDVELRELAAGHQGHIGHQIVG